MCISQTSAIWVLFQVSIMSTLAVVSYTAKCILVIVRMLSSNKLDFKSKDM